MLEAGQKAPEFTLRDVDGTSRSLKEILESGPAVLAFYKSSCPICQFTFPYLERLHKPAKSQGHQIIAISQDDAADTREFLNEFGCTFPALIDDPKTWPASNGFGISHVPSIFVIERDRQIAQSWAGWVKADMESLANKFSARLFRPNESVPAWKAG
jgi:peroxiredoxin